METISAQCVGREFVRQYYTLMHEAPQFLHRFYSHNSSFVHGGIEKPGEEQPPLVGQADIHKKILALKFNDCRAKIRQVDSQQTVGDAVMVQVSGELSNAQGAMRRFMQTFVLVAQSPKKYYVLNDIFRYQDEVFHDNDTDHLIMNDAPKAEDKDNTIEPAAPTTEEVVQEELYDTSEPTTASLSNGTSATQKDEAAPEEVVSVEVVSVQPVCVPTAAAVTPAPEEKEETRPADPVPAPAPEVAARSQPMSWAAAAAAPAGQRSVPAQAPPAANRPAAAPVATAPKAELAPKNASAPQDAKPQRGPRAPRGERTGREAGRNPPIEGQEQQQQQQQQPRQAQQKYADAQQLFVGNIAQNIEEQELWAFFESEFGRVLEVRINRKNFGARDNAPAVPNFGFVVFESPDSVALALTRRPLNFHNATGDHRLNIEEKKQRSERPNSGNRIGGRQNGNMGGRGGMGPRGNGRGGPARGGNRGGGYAARR